LLTPSEARRDLQALVTRVDEPGKPLRARRLLAALRRSQATLASGCTLARRSSFRGPTIAEPAVTLVLETPVASLERIYLRVEPRLPPDLVEIPPLRTRLVDLWIEPGRDRDAVPVQDIPEIAGPLGTLCRALWPALLEATSTADALARAEVVLASFTPDGFRTIACGRLRG
jgi:hypothetical protein